MRSRKCSTSANRRGVGISAAALLCAAGSWACASAPDDAEADQAAATELGIDEQALGMMGEMWLWSGGVVPYCYQPASPGSGKHFGPQPNTPEFNLSVQFMEDAIAKYEALPYAHIDFQGGGLCANWSSLQVGTDPTTLRIIITNNDAATRFCTPVSIAAGATIDVQCHVARQAGDEVDVIFGRFYGFSPAATLHELGHALGFAHEKDRRSETLDRCSTDPTLGGGLNGEAPSSITEYDADSIMNSTGYCHEHDYLTPVDIAGLTYVYPGSQADRLVVPFSYQVADALVTGAGNDQPIEFELRTEKVWWFHFNQAHWYRRSTQFGSATQTAIASSATLGTEMFPSTDAWLSASFTDEFGRARTTATKRVRRDGGLATAIFLASAPPY